MHCPKCPGVETEEIEIHSVKIDRCPQCGGAWYDQDELRQIKDRESNGDFRWIDVDLWQDADRVTVAERSEARCPKDGVALVVVRYGEQDVTVEVCPLCFGIWLDRGEYDKIIEHFEKKVDSETFAGYLREMEEEFVEVLRGRSELSNLGKVFYLLRLRFAAEHPVVVTIKEAVRHLFPE